MKTCQKCNKEIDREGYYCSDCLKKKNQYNRDTWIFCIEIGICPVCRKERIFGEEKTCPECRAKRANRKKPITEEQKERIRLQRRLCYYQRSEQGICTRCGKRKAMEGKKKCGICLQRDRELPVRRKDLKKDIRQQRVEQGLCYRCGKNPPTKNMKMCQGCIDECKVYLNKARAANRHWKQDNKLIFQRKPYEIYS